MNAALAALTAGLLLTHPAGADPGGGGAAVGGFQCPPCANGTREVALLVSSAEQEDDLTFRTGGINWFNWNRPDDVPVATYNRGIHFAKSVRDLRRILQETARDCERVKFLGISSHGAPGSVILQPQPGPPTGDVRLNLETMEGVFGFGLSCVMAPMAEIRFEGCNVGRECEGEDFLRGVAHYLLPRGGSVRANTYYSYTFAGTPTTSFGNEQALSSDPTAQKTSFESPPQSLNTCRERVQKDLVSLSALRTTGCTRGDEFMRRSAAYKADLIALNKRLIALNPIRERTDDEILEAGRLFRRTMLAVDYFLEDVEKNYPCVNGAPAPGAGGAAATGR